MDIWRFAREYIWGEKTSIKTGHDFIEQFVWLECGFWFIRTYEVHVTSNLFTWNWFRPQWSGYRKASLSELSFMHCMQQHMLKEAVYNLKTRLSDWNT